MKRILSLMLACLLLASCAAKKTQEQDKADSFEHQISVLWNHLELWKQDDISEYNRYYYAVTDLDRNGRLEIFAAITQGTGIFTTGALYEISPDFSTAEQCAIPNDDNSFIPEVIMQSAPTLHDTQSGTYEYILKDNARNGAAENMEVLTALQYKDGQMQCSALAWKYLHADNGSITIEYGSDDRIITAEDYENMAATYAVGKEAFETKFDWFTFADDVSEARLMQSWKVFE